MDHFWENTSYRLCISEHRAGGGPPSLYLTKNFNLIQCRKNLSPSTSVRACTLGVHLSQKLLLYPPPHPQKMPKSRPGGPKKGAKKIADNLSKGQKTSGQNMKNAKNRLKTKSFFLGKISVEIISPL